MQFDKKKTIIATAIFVVCVIVGFGTTFMLKTCGSQEEEEDVVFPTSSYADDDKQSGVGGNGQTDGSEKSIDHEKGLSPEQTERDTVFVQKRTYRKTIRDTIMDVTYRVRYIGKVRNSVLTNVRPKDSTLVKRIYVKPKPAQAPAPPAPPKMTSNEMKKMLKSGSYAGNDKIAPNFHILVTGQHGDEKRVESPMDVHEKIKFGQWQDISIIDMEYDNDGRVSAVLINPVY